MQNVHPAFLLIIALATAPIGMTAELPPGNPYLADSSYAMAHGDSAQQDALPSRMRVGEFCDEQRECGPRPLAPVYLCPDREHAAGPTGRCLRDPETHVCGWEFRGCPDEGDPLLP